MRNFSIIIVFILGTCVNAQTQDDIKRIIGETMHYPYDELIVEDLTESVFGNQGVSGVYRFISDDGKFAPMVVAFSSDRKIIDHGLEARLSQATSGGSGTIERFDLPNGVYGYRGLSMLGPGGEQELVYAVFPKYGIDFQIKLTVPRDGMLSSNVESDEYHELLREGGIELAERMVAAVAVISDLVSGNDGSNLGDRDELVGSEIGDVSAGNGDVLRVPIEKVMPPTMAGNAESWEDERIWSKWNAVFSFGFLVAILILVLLLRRRYIKQSK